jgi:hypothetical protein
MQEDLPRARPYDRGAFQPRTEIQTMMSIFGGKSRDENKSRAREAFEKVAGLTTDSRDARAARLRMGLLCRAHIDKTFIDGAEKTAAWQDAIANGGVPTTPTSVKYQTVNTGAGEVTAYLPDEIVEKVFLLGARYQKTEINAQRAIESVQAIADFLFRQQLHMDQSFDVLQFLRDELVTPDSGSAQADGQPAQHAAAGS